MNNDEIPPIPQSVVGPLPPSLLSHLGLGMKIPFEWFCGRAKYGTNFGENSPICKGEIPFTPCPDFSMRKIILRLTASWKVCSIKSYCRLSGFQEKAVRETIKKMVKGKVLLNLGRLAEMHWHEAAGELYAINYKHNGDPYYSGDFLDLHHPGYTRLGAKSEKDYISRKYYRTTGGYKVLRHLVGACEACARLVHEFNGRNWTVDKQRNKVNDPCYFAYSEHDLRGKFGWYNPDSDKRSKAYKDAPKLYATRVPDAWIVGRGMSLRFEYLRSALCIDDIEDRLNALPKHEKMIFLVESADHSGVNFDKISKIFSNINLPLKSKYNACGLPRYNSASEEKQFQEAMDWIFSVLKKSEMERENALKTSQDGADDPQEINIRELSLYYSQGIFYQWKRKPTPFSQNIYDMDGKLVTPP